MIDRRHLIGLAAIGWSSAALGQTPPPHNGKALPPGLEKKAASGNLPPGWKKQLKVGHAGTLDPFATGLLLILIGEECKNADKYLKKDKTYEFTAKLGEVSTTGDTEGEIKAFSDTIPTLNHVKEALEQCERNDLVEVCEIKKLDKFLNDEKTAEKILILCDESHLGRKASELLPNITVKNHEIVVLIGPEGGFSEEEFIRMRDLKNLYSMSLGPRILRADTAMIAALTLVQEFLGDF